MINAAFKLLKIVSGKETRNQKGVSQARSARKETFRIEVTVVIR